MGTMRGTVVRIVGEKGFGFVKADGDGGEFFFHRSAVDRATGFENLYDGQLVEFDGGPGPKGPRAENVRAV